MIPGHQEAPTGIYQGRHGYWGEVPLASWPQRAGSYLIDQAIGLAPLLLVLLARGDLGGVLWKPFFPLPWSALIAPPAVSLLCLMLWFANTCVLGGHTGRSVGKRVLGTSVYLQRLADHGDTAAGTSVAGRPQIPDRRWCRPEWRASVEFFASRSDPRIKPIYPHADERAVTFVVEVESAEDLSSLLRRLPVFPLVSLEVHPVTTPQQIVSELDVALQALSGQQP
jgi:hypothetical protein